MTFRSHPNQSIRRHKAYWDYLKANILEVGHYTHSSMIYINKATQIHFLHLCITYTWHHFLGMHFTNTSIINLFLYLQDVLFALVQKNKQKKKKIIYATKRSPNSTQALPPMWYNQHRSNVILGTLGFGVKGTCHNNIFLRGTHNDWSNLQ